jgi:hypothetical protein
MYNRPECWSVRLEIFERVFPVGVAFSGLAGQLEELKRGLQQILDAPISPKQLRRKASPETTISWRFIVKVAKLASVPPQGNKGAPGK